jgi:uncharacterized membrane protein YbhN (UPF0104 family)
MRLSKDLAAKGIVYVSFMCVVIYLWKADLLKADLGYVRWGLAVLAVAVAWVGYMLNAVGWHLTLRVFDASNALRVSVYSVARTAFVKYIPGKIWTIMGKALIVAQHGIPAETATFASFLAQAVTICTGLVMGMVLLVASSQATAVKIAAGAAAIMLAVGIASQRIQRFVLNLMERLLKREMTVLNYPRKRLVAVVAAYVLTWAVWSAGFLLLTKAVMPGYDLDMALLLVFPLAASLGIVCVIAPGGLGVREGLMVGLLVFLGMSPVQAASLALVARVWFLVTELLVFLTQFAVKPKH